MLAGGLTEDDGARGARTLLAEVSTSRPGAVLAFNDRCATGVLDTLLRAGVSVPGEISVVGFDDTSLSRLAHIDLTTVAQDIPRLAELAVGRAIARLDGEAVAEGRVWFRRGSSSAARRPRLLRADPGHSGVVGASVSRTFGRMFLR